MALILPKLTWTAIKRYGVPEVAEEFPQFFLQDVPYTQKIPIAICDQTLNMSETNFEIWKNFDEIPNDGIDNDNNGYIDDYRGYNFYRYQSKFTAGGGHGNNVANHLTRPSPELIAVMHCQIAEAGGAGHFTMLNAVKYAAQNGALAANTSFQSQSATMVLSTAEELEALGCFWLAPAVYGYPQMYANNADVDNIIVCAPMSIDHSSIRTWNASKTHLVAYADAHSYACPIPGSVLATLKIIDPSLTLSDLRTLLLDGAEMLTVFENKCQHGRISHKGSVELLLGRPLGSDSQPAPDSKPVLNADGPFSFEQNATINFKITADGGDGALTFIKVSGPDWLSIDLNTGVVSGMAPSDTQSQDITIEVTDEDGDKNSKTYMVHIVEQDTQPFISAFYIDDAETGDILVSALSVINGNGPFKYRILSAPDWIVIDDETGELFGVVPVEWSGECSVTIEVEDVDGDKASATAVFNIIEIKSPPVVVHRIVIETDDDGSYTIQNTI